MPYPNVQHQNSLDMDTTYTTTDPTLAQTHYSLPSPGESQYYPDEEAELHNMIDKLDKAYPTDMSYSSKKHIKIKIWYFKYINVHLHFRGSHLFLENFHSPLHEILIICEWFMWTHNWAIPSSDGIPLRGCRLFFFFFRFFPPPFLVFQWPTQREGNTGFRWYFADTCLLTLFTCCYKIFHMQSYFTEL